MTTYERFRRMFEHREADRVPIIDSPWAGTLRRWHREGMPEGADWRDYFGVDKVWSIGVDITPRYEVKVLEDTDRYTIATTPWGVTLKNFKELDSTPEFLDYKVQTPDDQIKTDELSRQLGCKVVSISALKGDGIMEAAEEAIKAAKGSKTIP
ncbi:MAG: hypothetical protein II680_06785, partial [Clostridia bacterium]|nr:hypothetical protein [Clostridia bacterium]